MACGPAHGSAQRARRDMPSRRHASRPRHSTGSRAEQSPPEGRQAHDQVGQGRDRGEVANSRGGHPATHGDREILPVLATVSSVDTITYGMNQKHRRTLAAIFDDPARSNISWRDIEAMLKAAGAE